MHHQTKELNDSELMKLKSMEEKTGHVIVAWEEAPQPAALNDDEIGEVQALEKDLAAVVVAYQS